MKHLAAVLFLASIAHAQDPPPPVLPIALPAPTMLPSFFVSGGGGFASPSGSFAYASESSLILPQNTYATVAQEYTLIKKQIQSCTLAGPTKPMYQFSVATFGLTGLGGGCTSSDGTNSFAGSGQAFLNIRWGKLPIGTMLTFLKNTNTGWKATLGFSWGRY